jgi:hypothetical protein
MKTPEEHLNEDHGITTGDGISFDLKLVYEVMQTYRSIPPDVTWGSNLKREGTEIQAYANDLYIGYVHDLEEGDRFISCCTLDHHTYAEHQTLIEAKKAVEEAFKRWWKEISK